MTLQTHSEDKSTKHKQSNTAWAVTALLFAACPLAQLGLFSLGYFGISFAETMTKRGFVPQDLMFFGLFGGCTGIVPFTISILFLARAWRLQRQQRIWNNNQT